ncbi:hypothetical protein FQZ97_720130 [compost metagenome]
MAAGIAGEHGLAPGRVVGEAACREDDGLGADRDLGTIAIHHRAAHLAVLDDQPACRRGFEHSHTQVVGGLGQPRDQRHAIDQVHGAAITSQVVEMGSEAPGDMDEGAQRAGHAEEGGEVGAGHDRHAHERGLAHGLAQARQQGAHFTRVVGSGDHLVATGGGAGGVAMHVGNAVAVDELQCGVLLEEADHLRAGLEKGIHQLGTVLLAQFMTQVGARLFDVFLYACAPRQGVARHPHPAAGPGGGATEHRVLLHQHHLLAVMGCRDCGSEACCA